MMIIPQTDPKANYLAHKTEIDAAIARVLNSGRYILGEEVGAFEKEFAAYIGVDYACGVGNGTDALALSLRACDVGPGDLVFTVSHTAVATVAAIELVGAMPVFVDIDPTTFTMAPDSLEAALANKPAGIPKAIIPVHLYGHPVDMQHIMAIARRHGLYVIEDCAQSHGAALAGRKTGAWGDIAAFSFYPTKNLGALGDGGMVVTGNADLANKVKLLREYGWRNRNMSEIPGGNSRLDEIQAAILRVKLRYLEEDTSRRIQLARIYLTRLNDVDLTLPFVASDCRHVYHLFVVRSVERDRLRAALEQKGIGTLIHYPVPVHLQTAYIGRVKVQGNLAESERAANEVVSLPLYSELTETGVHDICDSIEQYKMNI
jgi:dTDP-4-amino-4,6-dideoxygalactose transaminase